MFGTWTFLFSGVRTMPVIIRKKRLPSSVRFSRLLILLSVLYLRWIQFPSRKLGKAMAKGPVLGMDLVLWRKDYVNGRNPSFVTGRTNSEKFFRMRLVGVQPTRRARNHPIMRWLLA
jgi:hypothetical protein